MAGDGDDAFSEFVAAQSESLMRSAYLLTGRRADAEDAVQATLLKVYLAWHRIERREAAGAYARKALLHEVLAVRRGPLRRHWVTDRPPEVAVTADDGGTETRDLLHVALLRLPAKQRAVIVLRYYEDLTEQQTADVLGVRVGTVKQHASRGLSRLRQELDASAEELR
jgi:RNA polymerase sigma-70 factor (sigma-E family)